MRIEHYVQVPKNGLDWTCPSDFKGDSQDLHLTRINAKVKQRALGMISNIKPQTTDTLD